MCETLATFWSHHDVVTRQNGYHGSNFKAAWGTAQGGLISLNLFNVVVDKVVRTWLYMTVEYQTVAQEGL